MKVTKVNFITNGYKHTIVTKLSKKKSTITELIGTDIPLYKRIYDGKTVTEYDRDLFGKFIRR